MDSIFLSGWEYNRLYASNPLSPIQSALPAETLWNGGAQYWFFKHIYCTQEAFQGEIAASESLGWATGKIFEELKDKKILKPLDVDKFKLDHPDEYKQLCNTQNFLRGVFKQEDILRFLKEGQETRLEQIKLTLYAPLYKALGCVNNIGINSLKHWVEKPRSNYESSSTIKMGLERLARPIGERSFELRLGIGITDHPGKGVPSEEIELQKRVEKYVQWPMIPELLSGSLPQEDYHKALEPQANVYKPINDQLWQSYQKNKDNLLRLRDNAEKYLWPDLHNDWLPRLREDPDFLDEFTRLISTAAQRANFDALLNTISILLISNVADAIGTALPGGIGQFLGHGLKPLGFAKLAEIRKKTEGLTIFYQKAMKSG